MLRQALCAKKKVAYCLLMSQHLVRSKVLTEKKPQNYKEYEKAFIYFPDLSKYL